MPWKIEFSLKFFTVLTIHFLSFRIFEQLALALKNRFDLKFFTVLKYFYHSGFLSNLCLPWKFSLYWIYFLHSGFLSNLRLLWKTECALNSLTECILFIIQDFWATCACAEKSCPGIFHFFQIFLIIQEFWATCACPESRVCSENFHWIEIFFIIQEFWASRVCLENRICGNATNLVRLWAYGIEQGSANFFALRTGLKLKFFRGSAFKNQNCSAVNIYHNSENLELVSPQRDAPT